MKPSDYVFLETREARMLAAAYENIDKANLNPGAFPRAAASLAGVDCVPGFRIERTWFAMVAVGIIKPDGLDPGAAAFIKQAAYAAAGVKFDRFTLELLINTLKRQLREVTLERDRFEQDLAMVRGRLDAYEAMRHRAESESDSCGIVEPFDSTGHAFGCTSFLCVAHCKQPRKGASPESGC